MTVVRLSQLFARLFFVARLVTHSRGTVERSTTTTFKTTQDLYHGNRTTVEDVPVTTSLVAD